MQSVIYETALFESRASGKFLVDNGNGTMALKNFDEITDLKYAQWKFSTKVNSSGTSSGYLTNVGSGKKYYRSVTSSNSGSNFSFAITDNYLRINYYSNKKYYYLQDINGVPEFSASITQNTISWKIRKYAGKASEASIQNSVIKVIDKKSAAAVPMTEQLRNQLISIVINGYYNELSGSFDFTVVPWNEKNEVVEFN